MFQIDHDRQLELAICAVAALVLIGAIGASHLRAAPAGAPRVIAGENQFRSSSASVPTAARSRPPTGRPCGCSTGLRDRRTALHGVRRQPSALRIARAGLFTRRQVVGIGGSQRHCPGSRCVDGRDQPDARRRHRENQRRLVLARRAVARLGWSRQRRSCLGCALVAKGGDIVIADARDVWPCLVAGFEVAPGRRRLAVGHRDRGRVLDRCARVRAGCSSCLTEIAVPPDGSDHRRWRVRSPVREAACRGSDSSMPPR